MSREVQGIQDKKSGCSQIYWDECSIGNEPYMGIGAVTVSRQHAPEIANAIKELRRGTIMERREFKWAQLCPKSLPVYSALSALAFKNMRAKRLAFSGLVLDKCHIDYDTHHEGSPHLGMLRFASTLIAWRCVQFTAPGERLVVFPDDKDTDVCFEEARRALHGLIRKVHRYQRNTVSNVNPVRSMDSQFGQLNDVLLGAVMYHWNQWHVQPLAKKCKVALAEQIAKAARMKSLALQTAAYARFSIWELDFDKAHKKSPPNPTSVSAEPSR
jgi:hypothetical protein